MSQLFGLTSTNLRRQALDAVNRAPDHHCVTVGPDKRGKNQNALLHAILRDVATQCQWAGQQWPPEVWKRLMTAAWLRATMRDAEIIPSLDGQGVEIIYVRTSELNKSQCSELCEYIYAWGSERGVRWSKTESGL